MLHRSDSYSGHDTHARQEDYGKFAGTKLPNIVVANELAERKHEIARGAFAVPMIVFPDIIFVYNAAEYAASLTDGLGGWTG